MFKVGDRVKNLEFSAFAKEGEIGTIKRVIDDKFIMVDWDSDVGGWSDIECDISNGHGELKFPTDLEPFTVVYNGGDILYKGSQLLRERENKKIKSLGYQVYSPKDDKEINDKDNQTVEQNNDLSLKIVEKDTKGMLDSDVLLFEYQRFSEGTIAEIGQTYGMKTFAEIIKFFIDHPSESDTLESIIRKIKTECDKMINKPVYCHCEDIRRTDIPEIGDKRSFYINQYVYGLVRKLCGGFTEWEDIVKKLKEN